MSGPNGAGHPTSNGHKPPPVTPLRGDPDPISTSPDEPPRDTGSEQALLGALLIANAAYPRVAGVLRTTHFALPVHQRIYAAMGILIERGEEANPVTLGRYFEQDQALAPAGGAGYLMKLAQCAVTVSNALDYARTIVDLAHAREAMFAAQDLIAAVCNPTPDASAADHIARMRAQLEDIIVRRVGR